MQALVLVTGIVIGFVVRGIYSRRVVQYYKNRSENALKVASTSCDEAKIYKNKVQRLEKLGLVEGETMDNKIDRGILGGIQIVRNAALEQLAN